MAAAHRGTQLHWEAEGRPRHAQAVHALVTSSPTPGTHRQYMLA